MKTVRKFDFNYQGYKWLIERSRHLYENRGPSDFSRDEFIDKTRYIEIFKSALRNGITSFRGKGAVVVTLPDNQGRFWSILCELREDMNKFFIITVFRVTNGKWWKSFIKTPQRINIMYDYVIPRMTKDERKAKEFDKLFNEVEQELNADRHFFMNAFNDVERKFN